ncbi:TetR/AcrR family transcriptional regulator [Bacillus anthracis]|uniref:TetR/AcrR family transcriptional regulator n=1 Tax=Bacillus anthracis TaxID=1392 RepID=UPI002DB7C868|nr:TetR/AcrR family transcriptional regulator [Bacillus anthracis]MEC0073950.1 TetR/AcrR family transcriptional regulator [Bacillus anthracis]MEC0099079.1 TetR/AcrR family transcriptional regulator [Bacillus anthracis]
MEKDGKQTDLRIRRTHKLLVEALVELMIQPEKKYSSLTINQICEYAMVHRTTFYKHFEDKDALLAFTLKHYQEEAFKIPLSVRLTKPFQVLEQIFNHEKFGKVLESQMNDELFINRMYYHNRDIQIQENQELKRLCKNHKIPIELIITYHSGVLTTLTAWWFQNRNNVLAEEMDEYFHQLISQDIFQLEKYE